MNAVSKSCLQLLFLGNGSRVGNGQKGFTELGLVDWRPKSSSDKAPLNVLRAENVRQVGARPIIERDNKVDIGGDDKAGTGRKGNEIGKKRDNKAGTDETTKQTQENKTTKRA